MESRMQNISEIHGTSFSVTNTDMDFWRKTPEPSYYVNFSRYICHKKNTGIMSHDITQYNGALKCFYTWMKQPLKIDTFRNIYCNNLSHPAATIPKFVAWNSCNLSKDSKVGIFLLPLPLLLLLLLLLLHYSLMQTFASLMYFSQSTLLFYLSFQFVVLDLLISVCTQFQHVFWAFLFSVIIYKYWSLLQVYYYQHSCE